MLAARRLTSRLKPALKMMGGSRKRKYVSACSAPTLVTVHFCIQVHLVFEDPDRCAQRRTGGA